MGFVFAQTRQKSSSRSGLHGRGLRCTISSRQLSAGSGKRRRVRLPDVPRSTCSSWEGHLSFLCADHATQPQIVSGRHGIAAGGGSCILPAALRRRRFCRRRSTRAAYISLAAPVGDRRDCTSHGDVVGIGRILGQPVRQKVIVLFVQSEFSAVPCPQSCAFVIACMAVYIARCLLMTIWQRACLDRAVPKWDSHFASPKRAREAPYRARSSLFITRYPALGFLHKLGGAGPCRVVHPATFDHTAAQW